LTYFSIGLFHAAIVQSRTATSAWALNLEPVNAVKKLAMTLNCKTASTRMIVDCLKRKNASAILRAERNMIVIFLKSTFLKVYTSALL